MGSYVKSVMSNGERVDYEAKISVWSMLPAIILGFLLLPVLGVGLLIWLTALIRYKTTELTITNKKIIAKFGFISRDTVELLLPKVESIQVKQSLMGRMLNYGSIIVAGAGTPQAPIPGINDPIQFRRTFMELQEKSVS